METNKNKVDSNRKMNGIDAYNLFIQQMGGKTSTGNKEFCKGINCDKEKCRIACGALREFKTKK